MIGFAPLTIARGLALAGAASAVLFATASSASAQAPTPQKTLTVHVPHDWSGADTLIKSVSAYTFDSANTKVDLPLTKLGVDDELIGRFATITAPAGSVVYLQWTGKGLASPSDVSIKGWWNTCTNDNDVNRDLTICKLTMDADKSVEPALTTKMTVTISGPGAGSVVVSTLLDGLSRTITKSTVIDLVVGQLYKFVPRGKVRTLVGNSCDAKTACWSRPSSPDGMTVVFNR